MRTRTCIDKDWRFALGDCPEALNARHDDSTWRLLDLPHDWSIEATPHPDHPAGAGGGFFPGGLGWYRRQIEIPADLGDRRVLIEFDGVYMNSEVWCNGRFCGGRPYGYSSFCYDLTQHVRAGEAAVVAVRVDNSRQKNSRWYSGSGIYRHVWLTLAGPLRVAHWGTFVTTPEVGAEAATVQCDVTLVNDSSETAEVEVEVEVEVAGVEGCSSCQTVRLSSGPESLTSRLALPNPRLWSPDAPNLYTLRVVLKQDGRVLDRYDTRFGIRTLRFDANDGFFLNGASLKMRGVNEHHDAGCLGAAVPDDVLRRRFRILKEMGCNAIRVAHNPASPTFLDLCDEMGFLVVEDAFDEWREGKTPFGYQLYWDAWWERDLCDMIRRDRNHPCVVMWSVGNEIIEVRQGQPAGLAIMRALRTVCHREDPTRPMTCGCCNTRQTLVAGYGPLMDVVGYNGGGGGCFDYAKDHAAHPEMVIFASEVPHSLQTRDVYRTRTWYRDLARNADSVLWHESGVAGAGGGVSDAGEGAGSAARKTRPAAPDPQAPPRPPLELMRVPDLTKKELFTGFDPHYQSSYDNAMVRISSIDSWRLTKTLPFVCGEFRWTGFDYLGECYAWPAKSWNFGVIDLCGFPKDTYYFYQSEWTDAPMVHLLPHWTWPGLEGEAIPVVCYTNCERVELWLNGVSLGTRTRDPEAMLLRWDVPYAAGELKAVGFRSEKTDGPGGTAGEAPVATGVRETAGAPAALRVVCEEASLRADGSGIGHFEIAVVDAAGRVLPFADDLVTVKVRGPASLIGLENGDPLDSTNYRVDHRRVFHGRMLAVVQAGGQPGRVTLSASAEGLAGGSCFVEAQLPESQGL